MESVHKPEKSILIEIVKICIIIYIASVLCAIAYSRARYIYGGVAFAGGLSLVNFALYIQVSRWIFKNPNNPKWVYLSIIWVKFGVLVLIIYFAVSRNWFHPVAILIGFSDIVVAVFWVAVLMALRMEKGIES